jgi:Glycosyl-transferase for dystroglycan
MTSATLQMFEPYVVALRAATPWYDERFRGYYYDKAVQLHHMWRLGFRFAVHPNAFVVHFPHASSGAAAVMMTFKLDQQVHRNECQIGTKCHLFCMPNRTKCILLVLVMPYRERDLCVAAE